MRLNPQLWRPITGSQAVNRFLRTYPEHVREIALAARSSVIAVLPDSEETLDASAKVIGFGYGPGYKGLIFTLILSKKGVKLGVVRGAALHDPEGLMAGSGKIHRHVQLNSVSDVTQSGLRELMERAVKAWRTEKRQQSEMN